MSLYMDWNFNLIEGMYYSLKSLEEEGETDNPLTCDTYRKCMMAGIPVYALLADVFRKAPDWTLSYYTDHRRIPGVIKTIFNLIYPAMFTLGYLLVPPLERINEGTAMRVMAALGALEVFLFLSNFKRLNFVGTLQEFEKGEGKLIMFHPIGWRFALIGVILAIRYGWVSSEWDNKLPGSMRDSLMRDGG